MVIDVQFEEASDLLWELLRALPEEKQATFASRVNRVSSALHHPQSLDADVVVAFSPRQTWTLPGSSESPSTVPPGFFDGIESECIEPERSSR
ncbi:MAG: hypothetical protein KGL39_33345 [Patescibacteria group bacterium]|nr:hypothetical protein [Patescibacteria group bacterium]